jgi:hypothetical protein
MPRRAGAWRCAWRQTGSSPGVRRASFHGQVADVQDAGMEEAPTLASPSGAAPVANTFPSSSAHKTIDREPFALFI